MRISLSTLISSSKLSFLSSLFLPSVYLLRISSQRWCSQSSNWQFWSLCPRTSSFSSFILRRSSTSRSRWGLSFAYSFISYIAVLSRGLQPTERPLAKQTADHQIAISWHQESATLPSPHFYNQKSNIQKLIAMPLVLVLFCLLCLPTAPRPVRQVPSKHRDAAALFVNQLHELSVPFEKCFKVQAQLQANQPFLHFRPSRVELQFLKGYSLKKEGSKISVLQQLRSAITYKHGHLLVMDSFLLVFFAPNCIIVVEESSEGFTVKNRYYLQHLDRFDKFKMYKLAKDRAILLIHNKPNAFLLNSLDYEDYLLPSPSSIVHLDPLSPELFLAAEFSRGLALYRLDRTHKAVEEVRRIAGEDVGLQGRMKYIVDVNLVYYPKDRVILALDAQIGLIQITEEVRQKDREDQFNSTSQKSQKQSDASSMLRGTLRGRVAVGHRMCESFDTVRRSHVVLLCQNQGHSTIVQSFREWDRKSKQYHYRKAEPVFQGNYLNDLHVGPHYFLAYSYKNIHTFWVNHNSNQIHTVQTQGQIVLPGLETFAFVRQPQNEDENLLYTIEGGQLNKYTLKEMPAELKIGSDRPVTKEFRIFLYGNCRDLEAPVSSKGVKQQETASQTCRESRWVSLQVSQQEYAREEDVGVSASIVVILVTVFLLVIWICLKKYKGLERQARKVLQNYQNKRARATRSI